MELKGFRQEDTLVSPLSGYVDTGIQGYLRRMVGQPLVLVGPTGSGKTLAVQQFAAEGQYNLVEISCSRRTTERHLKGGLLPTRDGMDFALGVITGAIELANKTGEIVLVLVDELNGLNEHNQTLLNQFLGNRSVTLAKAGRIMRVHQGAVWFIGTMNPHTYGGRAKLNRDLKDRLSFVQVPYMRPELERQVLCQRICRLHQAADKEVVAKLVHIATEMRGEGQESLAISTRQLCTTVDLWKGTELCEGLGLKGALKQLEGSLPESARAAFAARVSSHVKVDLDDIDLMEL